jgi:hypothetical protein
MECPQVAVVFTRSGIEGLQGSGNTGVLGMEGGWGLCDISDGGGGLTASSQLRLHCLAIVENTSLTSLSLSPSMASIGGQCGKKNLLHCAHSAVNFPYRTAFPPPPTSLYSPVNLNHKLIRNQQKTVTYIKERSGT